jgi:hypothetical protein
VYEWKTSLRIAVKLPHHSGLKRQGDALSDPFSEVFLWQIVVGSKNRRVERSSQVDDFRAVCGTCYVFRNRNDLMNFSIETIGRCLSSTKTAFQSHTSTTNCKFLLLWYLSRRPNEI